MAEDIDISIDERPNEKPLIDALETAIGGLRFDDESLKSFIRESFPIDEIARIALEGDTEDIQAVVTDWVQLVVAPEFERLSVHAQEYGKTLSIGIRRV